MSIILEGIDLPKHGETKRIVLYDNGDIVVDEDGWDEDGNRYYRTTYDIQAIQIPNGHGNLKDENEIKKNSIDDGYDLYVSWTDIDNAPSILESEEDDECNTERD